MMCYKDRAWCPFWEDCANAEGCDRKLTDLVVIEAAAAKQLISRYAEPPVCHEPVPPEDTDR